MTDSARPAYGAVLLDIEGTTTAISFVYEVLFPYASVGLMVVNQGLQVEYDDTRWKLFALQPTLHAGAGWAPAEPVLLSLGADLGLKQKNQSTKGAGVFYRLAGAAGYRF